MSLVYACAQTYILIETSPLRDMKLDSIVYPTALLLEIKAFQPAVVPIRAVTTLTLQTDAALNVTVNSSLQCRFKDVSVSARLEDGFVFCDTPPMRNIDKVSLYLDVDGRLFKTKKPLYFHGE